MAPAAKLPPCPICKRPRDAADRRHAPFCSARCRSIDLGNWLGGTYAIPAMPAEEEGDAGPLPSESLDDN